jgi:hypothetical protein
VSRTDPPGEEEGDSARTARTSAREETPLVPGGGWRASLRRGGLGMEARACSVAQERKGKRNGGAGVGRILISLE